MFCNMYATGRSRTEKIITSTILAFAFYSPILTLLNTIALFTSLVVINEIPVGIFQITRAKLDKITEAAS
jgi:hypothetical protein